MLGFEYEYSCGDSAGLSPQQRRKGKSAAEYVEMLVASVKKTSRALVVDGGYAQYGAAGEIAAILSDHAFDWLDAPVKRLAAENVPIPMSRTLEPLVQPSEAAIADAVHALVGQRRQRGNASCRTRWTGTPRCGSPSACW